MKVFEYCTTMLRVPHYLLPSILALGRHFLRHLFVSDLAECFLPTPRIAPVQMGPKYGVVVDQSNRLKYEYRSRPLRSSLSRVDLDSHPYLGRTRVILITDGH